MLKIGDFSRLGHVTVRTLRLYDDLGLLKPAHLDPMTGYRYYDLSQLPLLNRILALKELGLELEQIRRMLQRPLSPEAVRGMLQLKQAELSQHMEQTRAQLDRLALRLRQMEQEGQLQSLPDVHLKPLPALKVATIRAIVPRVEEVGIYCHAHFSLLGDWLRTAGVSPSSTLNLYYAEEYREEQIEMESAAVLADPVGVAPPPGVALRSLEAVPQAAVMTVETRPPEIALAITDLLAWVGQSGLVPAGALREVHHFGAVSQLCADDRVVIELQVPVVAQG